MKTQFRNIALLLGISLMLGLAACDSNLSEDYDATLTDEDFDTIITDIAEELPLSATKTNSLRSVLADHEGEPGALWYVAADLQESLSETELEKLLTRPEHGMQGQGGPGGQGHGGMKGRRGGEDGQGPLADILTDEQKEEVKTLRQDMRTAFEALKASFEAEEITEEEFHTAARALHEEMRAAVDALLTDEQRAELEAKRAEHEAEMEARREAGKDARNEVLELSDDESDVLDALFADFKAQHDELHEQVRNGELDRDAAQEAMETMRAANEEALAGELDETQIEIVKIHQAILMRAKMQHMRGQKGRKGGRRGGK